MLMMAIDIFDIFIIDIIIIIISPLIIYY